MGLYLGGRRRNLCKRITYFRTPHHHSHGPLGRGGGPTMILLGAGRPGRTSLGLIMLRPPWRQVSTFTSCVWGDNIVFCPPCGAPPSAGPPGPVCFGEEVGRLDLTAYVHLPYWRRLVPSAEVVSPLAEQPKFDLGEGYVKIPDTTMRVSHTFQVV